MRAWVAEALISVALLRHLAGTWHPFERSRHVVIFLLGSCLAAALVGGTIGTFSLWAGGFVPKGEFGVTFVTFVLADAAGIAVFCALVLAWYREPRLDRLPVLTCWPEDGGPFLTLPLVLTDHPDGHAHNLGM